MKYIVLFDTNSYRDIVFEKNIEEALVEINEIKKLEDRKGINASAICTVTTELLGNLVDSSAIYNYKDCLNSLIIMSKHCFDDKIGALRITPTPYGHIAKSLFSFIPSEFEKDLKNTAGLLSDFGKDSNNAIVHYQKQDTFRIAKKFLNDGEAKFIENIIDLINNAKFLMQERFPNATKKQQKTKLLHYLKSEEFENNFAIGMVATVSQVLRIPLTPAQLIARSKFLNAEFPVSVGFFKYICHKVVDLNLNLKTKISRQRRWNWIWDFHVSFTCSRQTMEGREVILVTSDKEMREMLEQLKLSDKIFDIDSYKKFLKT